MPPIRGINNATIIASKPNIMVEIRATLIKVLSELCGKRRLNISLVTTPEEILRVALRELAVANTIPLSISPSKPAGSTSLHIIR